MSQYPPNHSYRSAFQTFPYSMQSAQPASASNGPSYQRFVPPQPQGFPYPFPSAASSPMLPISPHGGQNMSFHTSSTGIPSNPTRLQPQSQFNPWPYIPPSNIAMQPPPLLPPPPPAAPPSHYNPISQFTASGLPTNPDATYLDLSASRQHAPSSHNTSGPHHTMQQNKGVARVHLQHASHKEDGEVSDGESSPAEIAQQGQVQSQAFPPFVRIDGSLTKPTPHGNPKPRHHMHLAGNRADVVSSPREQARKYSQKRPTRSEARLTVQSNARNRNEHQGVAHVSSNSPEPGTHTAYVQRPSQDVAIDAIALKFLDTERRKAKDFILLLHENGYSFADLADHGLDRSMLTGLYEELNLPLAPNKMHSVEKSTSQSVASPLEPPPLAAASPKHYNRGLQQPVSVPLKSTSSIPVRQDAGAQSLAVPLTPSSSQLNHQRIRHAEEHTTSASAQTKLQPQGPEPTAKSVSLERKDVIARLMAAKTKKTTLPTAPISLPPRPDVSIPESLLVTPPNRPDAIVGPQILPTSNTTGKISSLPLEDKRKAQTELARLRMEALESARRAMAAQAKVSIEPNQSISGKAKQLPTTEENHLTVTASTNSTRAAVDKQESANSSVSALTSFALDATAPAENGASNKVQQVQLETQSSPHFEPQPIKMRKRPVAADFDDTSHLPPAKRPFGQDRHDSETEGIIIEASTDESDSESDSQYSDTSDNEHNSRSSNTLSKPRLMHLRDLPPLSDKNARLVSGRTNGQSMPSTPQSMAIIREVERLKQQEQEILDMKRRIAQAEEKRKARSSQSGNSTPVKAQVSATQVKQSKLLERFPSDASVSEVEHGDLNGVAIPFIQPDALEKRAAPAGTSLPSNERTIPSSSSDISAHWRQQRRAEIQSGLPALEASYVSNASRLDELRAQMKEIEQRMQKELEDKTRLVDELQALGIDTEGMQEADLLAAKLSMNGQTEAELPLNVPLPIEPSTFRIPTSNSSATSMSMSNSDKDDEPGDSSSEDANVDVSLESTAPGLHSSKDGKSEAKGLHHGASSDKSMDVLAEVPVSPMTSPTPDSLSEADVDDDLYGSESGEIESNDPELRDGSKGAHENPVNFQSIPSAAREGNTDDSDVSDFYTTTAAATPRKDPLLDDVPIPDLSDEKHEEHSKSNSGAVQGLESSDSAASQKVLPIPYPVSASFLADKVADHPTSEYAQGSLPATLSALPHHIEANVTDTDAFRPYVSPLKQFKKYRLHPQFGSDISGGFQSLSYSHHIDPNIPMCEFEIAGGICNDETCDSQHFRSIALQADGLVAQLARANPGHTDADAARWKAGLQNIVTSALLSGTLGSAEVAGRVAALWKSLSIDPTKILDLNNKGPTIT